MFAPVGTAMRSARAAARSAASWSPRIPAMTESTVSAAAIHCGSRSSVARRLASSAAGIATPQSATCAAIFPCRVSMRGTEVSSTALAGRASMRSLSRDGFRVSVVQNPTLSLEGDVEAARRIIDAQDGPVVLVGHSYGGAVITEAGRPPERRGPGLHLRIRAGQGRVGQHAHRRFPGRRAAAADPASPGWLPVPGPGQIPRVVRRRPARGPGRVHGRRTGPLGGGRPRPERSPTRPGGPSPAGTWLPRRTG